MPHAARLGNRGSTVVLSGRPWTSLQTPSVSERRVVRVGAAA